MISITANRTIKAVSISLKLNFMISFFSFTKLVNEV
jgi:hypothetical protein